MKNITLKSFQRKNISKENNFFCKIKMGDYLVASRKRYYNCCE